jgi:BirA family transcriptional regulator, biotin operon repressor / biotin---[acetyl-CoA-carboxylase] ligase
MSWDESLFQRNLATRKFGREFVWLAETDSTNQWLATNQTQFSMTGGTVVADHQTQGRGRRDRTWLDRPSASLLFSLLLRHPAREDWAGLIGMLPAIALARHLSAHIQPGVVVSLKWPNDVLLNGKKLAGILGQTTRQGSACTSIVGVGVNVAMSESEIPGPLHGQATSLLVELSEVVRREILLAEILNHWEPLFDEYLEGDCDRLRGQWREFGPRRGDPIVRREGVNTVSGWFEDIGEQGQLLLRDESGLIHEVFSGDVQT